MADYNSDRTGSNIDLTLDKVDALDAKVQPIATGVDVTGTITADGLSIGSIRGLMHIGTGDIEDDGNTIDFNGARPLSFSVSGTERARIDSSGNVGIGTASPSAKLDVVGDINVSGGVYLGGTGAANKLDDYEEGTFTATIKGDTAEPTTLIELTSQYTKVGRIVHFQIGFENIDTTGYSGAISVIGLPFTNRYSRATVNVVHYKTTSWTTSQTPVALIGGNSNQIDFISQTSGNVWTVNQHVAGTARYLFISGSYTTTD